MNLLSKETSPYLLQHKDNPVNWYSWNDEAWRIAKEENKMVIVSIGYSSCHWCHVMEHQVFEDYECAEIMNRHFICIKVDREERPDVDSIYMDAVHLMGGRGGWPLNVFTLPDGRPVYGGTYFPKEQWISVLENLHGIKSTEVEKLIEYAGRLHEGMQTLNVIANNNNPYNWEIAFLDEVMMQWSKSWDLVKGGARKSPKFPMPNNLELVLHFGVLRNDELSQRYVHLTLTKMALGGIYDQAGGGFSRYSVDDSWKVPHFEKMLYDNAQLISVYAQAYRQKPTALYEDLIRQTFSWLEREMKSEEGLYYSALDADSEGVEGKFYTWSEEELEKVVGEDWTFTKEYYSLGREGLWEHDQNILLRNETDDEFALSHNMSLSELMTARKRVNERILAKRDSRIRPGLDDKYLTSWNAMLVTAYIDAYKSLGDDLFLASAKSLFSSIIGHLSAEDGKLFHTYTKGKAHINGFLDDYACLAECAIQLYEVSLEKAHLKHAEQLVDKIFELFSEDKNQLFYFSEKGSDELIARKQEVQDNVIPASNSILCKVLFKLAHYLENEKLADRSDQMLKNILPQISHASGYSNWLQVYAFLTLPFHEMVICGENAEQILKEVMRSYLPNTLVAASTTESELPLFRNRFGSDTAIYVCTDKTCHAPVFDIQSAMQLIK